MSKLAKIATKTPIAKKNRCSSRTCTTPLPRPIHPVIDHILTLQRTVGNQAVQRLLKDGTLQAKLKIGEPGDIYEQEADRLAEQVMKMAEPPVHRLPEEEEERKEEEEFVQTKPVSEQITPLVQRQIEEEEEELQMRASPGQTPHTGQDIEARINAIKGGGQPLTTSTRAFFKPRFGADFSGVRVHTDSNSACLARNIDAKAFTVGRDVIFGPGQYSPETSRGKKLLAHELTHVVQQQRAPASERSIRCKADEKSKFKPMVSEKEEKEYERRKAKYLKEGKTENEASFRATDDMLAERLKGTGGKRLPGTATSPYKPGTKTYVLVSSAMSIEGKAVPRGFYFGDIDDKSYNCHSFTFKEGKVSKLGKLKTLAKTVPKEGGEYKGKKYYDTKDLVDNKVYIESHLPGPLKIFPRWIGYTSEVKDLLKAYRPRKGGEKLSVAKRDIAMYSTNGDFAHSGQIVKVDSKGNPIKVKGKFGHFSLFEHEPLSVPAHYGRPSYFRKK